LILAVDERLRPGYGGGVMVARSVVVRSGELSVSLSGQIEQSNNSTKVRSIVGG
jgi:hypothetical protein